MKKYLFIAMLAMAGVIAFTGCRKKKDTIAKITVKDAANANVAGATVVLYASPSEQTNQQVTIYDTTETNSSGVAVFNYNDVYQLGQAGVAVLDIKAWKNGNTGTGIIKVEQEVTTEETVYIN